MLYKTTATVFLSLALLIGLGHSQLAWASDHEFISIWKTAGADETITIPTHNQSTYDYTIDCGEGGLITSAGESSQTATRQTGNATCDYATAGTHEIRISGVFPRIYFANIARSKDKLITVEQWGTVGWNSMESAFLGATKLTSVPNNTTGLESVRNMQTMFAITSMFDADISNWNVSAVTNMDSMFVNATAFDQNLGLWYIILAPDPIANIAETSLEIKTQNIALDNQNPVYDIAGADADKFSLSGNTLTLTNPDSTASSYALTISSSGLFGTDNQRAITVLVVDAPRNTDFVSTWKTDADDENITIPTTGGGYNYTINCGKGGLIAGSQVATGQTRNATCSYAIAGTHEIRISGTFPRIYNLNAVSRNKLITVERWGSVGWTTMHFAFYEASQLTSVPNNTTGLENVRSTSLMFASASMFNADISNWNVGGVTNMSYMFSNTKIFNADISNWNVSAVTSMEGMFVNAKAFDQDINLWDVSSVTTMDSMFNNADVFNQDISSWDVRKVFNMNNMFLNANAFNQNLGAWYIVPESAPIANTAGTSLEINAQNMALDGQSPEYGIIGGTDADKFSLSGNILTLNATDSTATAYTLIISSSGSFGANNQRAITVLVVGSPRDTDFISTWKTDADGESIIIPTTADGYNYTINCGEGGLIAGLQVATGQTGSATCSYAIAGTHEIRISGTFPRIYNFNAVSRNKLITVERWGSVGWDSMTGAFNGATKLTSVPNNTIGLRNVRNMAFMFSNARIFNQDISDWNVSSVTDMQFMFFNARAFNQNIGSWNVNSVTNMEGMFATARAFNQDISLWNVSAVTNMGDMFIASAFNKNLGRWYIVPPSNLIANTAGTTLDIATQNTYLDNQNPTYNIIGENMGFSISGNTLTLNTPDLTVSSYTLTISSTGSFGTNNQRPITILLVGSPRDTDFVSTWKTTGTNKTITIPTTGSGYNYTINCGKGGLISGAQITTGQTRNTTCSYAVGGIHKIRISGDFPRIYFENDDYADREKILSIERWGNQIWTSMEKAFWGATNLTITASDEPDLSAVTDMSFMFVHNRKLNAGLRDWNVSNVQNMRAIFSGTNIFNGDISNWNVSSVTNMIDMFVATNAFNQDISNWNVSAVTDMRGMFYNAVFNQNLGKWYIIPSLDFFDSNVIGVNLEITTQNTYLDNQNPVYTIVGENTGFSIIGNTLTLNSPTSTVGAYNLIISASGDDLFGTDNQRILTINFPISISDQTRSISEDANVGANVDIVLTTIGNPTRFEIIAGNIDGDFAIDNNGQITVAKALDFEKTTRYDLTVEISKADATRQTATITISIDNVLEDTISIATQTRIIPENIGVDANVGAVLSATGTPTRFEIVAGDDNNDFAIDDNGQITVAKTLDFATTPNYDLTVKISKIDAVDATATITIIINKIIDGSFVTTWKTTRANETITIPIHNGSIYDYTINCGKGGLIADAQVATGQTRNATCNFAIAGIHKIRISGDFPRIYFENDDYADREKILSIERWGNQVWTSMEKAFYGATNLTITATDAPNLSQVSSMLLMFIRNTKLNTGLRSWDVSNVQNMQSMFNGASIFNGDISNWNVRSVFDMSGMFANAGAFDQDISSWNVRGVTHMAGMFAGVNVFSQNLGKWYVVPESNPISNTAGATLDITTQNTYLDNQNPIYDIVGENMGFSISGNTITLNNPDLTASDYELIISATGANLYGTDNQRTLTITVDAGFNLDIDGNGSLDASTDGLLILRFMFEQLSIDTTNALAPDKVRTDAEILSYLQNNVGRLDIDGSSGSLNASTDGLLILRFMDDQSSLDTTNALSPDKTRTDEQILQYLQSLVP